MRKNDRPLLVVIAGPTATGKTDVGIEVAARIGGEVISADSMMVYKGMDIGTAKPTIEERRGVPHHLIDVIRPDEDFSVAVYQDLAEKAIAGVAARSRMPLLVGGTGLYIRSVIEPYHFAVPSNPELRRQLSEEARICGREVLHRRLAAVDPETAARVHPNNVRRIIRALEVYYQTGRPLSQFHECDRRRETKYNLLMFGLYLERELLYKRIEKRVDKMVEQGLVDEVKRLLQQGYGRDLVSMQGLGYKEIIYYLEGETTLDEAIRILKRNTRRFAKRQFTWFRRDKRIRWINMAEQGGVTGAAEEIIKALAGQLRTAAKKY
ncbi:MAG: tRNA (adenosine(37)-N6)-dimethylallyltransferase MiaA [Peptococcaceae bacterium]|nr:tRNA (adenosine(37)-N6)-dimethylallyltransferase MiaA [Peptococcaceae bacterium]